MGWSRRSMLEALPSQGLPAAGQQMKEEELVGKGSKGGEPGSAKEVRAVDAPPKYHWDIILS